MCVQNILKLQIAQCLENATQTRLLQSRLYRIYGYKEQILKIFFWSQMVTLQHKTSHL